MNVICIGMGILVVVYIVLSIYHVIQQTKFIKGT